MSEENKEKLLNHMGTNLLNKLNIGGIVEASKFYSLHLASQHYEQMTEKDRADLLESIEKQGEAQPQEVDEPEVEIIEP